MRLGGFILKAIVVSEFGDPDTLKLIEKPIPKVNENQLLIKVKATSVNYADIKMRKGSYPGEKQLPFTPGLDVAGIVSDIGKNVEKSFLGQNVVAFPSDGSYAEYIIVEKDMVYPIPSKIDFVQAAAFTLASFVAYDLVSYVGKLAKNESLLIHSGSGGVGTYAIQFAKLLGCQSIIVTVGSSHKKDYVKKIGAHHAIHYQKENVKEKVLELTDGKGIDLIFNSIGGDTFHTDMSYLSPFGRIIYYGNASNEKVSMDIDQLYPSSRSIIGYSFGKVRKEDPSRVANIAEKILPLLENESVKLLIPKVFPIEEVAKAHSWMESRNHMGKIVITM